MPDTKGTYYRVGGHLFLVCEDTKIHHEKLMPSIQPFAAAHTEEDPVFTLHIQLSATLPIPSEGLIGTFDCGGCLHDVYDLRGEGYCIVFHHINGDTCGLLCTDKNGQEGIVHLMNTPLSHQQFVLGNATMIAYAYATADKKTVLMHASVVSLEGKGYLMTAPSGTGKSTHTRLWRQCFDQCELVNDDNPVVRIEQGKAMVYGSPWSGKTPCYRNASRRVSSIVNLSQAPFNAVRPVKGIPAYSFLLSSVSSVRWDRKVMDSLTSVLSRIAMEVPCYRMDCLPDADAAMTCCRVVESNESNEQ